MLCPLCQSHTPGRGEGSGGERGKPCRTEWGDLKIYTIFCHALTVEQCISVPTATLMVQLVARDPADRSAICKPPVLEKYLLECPLFNDVAASLAFKPAFRV